LKAPLKDHRRRSGGNEKKERRLQKKERDSNFVPVVLKGVGRRKRKQGPGVHPVSMRLPEIEVPEKEKGLEVVVTSPLLTGGTELGGVFTFPQGNRYGTREKSRGRRGRRTKKPEVFRIGISLNWGRGTKERAGSSMVPHAKGKGPRNIKGTVRRKENLQLGHKPF